MPEKGKGAAGIEETGHDRGNNRRQRYATTQARHKGPGCRSEVKHAIFTHT
jgi:hypothetical protein